MRSSVCVRACVKYIAAKSLSVSVTRRRLPVRPPLSLLACPLSLLACPLSSLACPLSSLACPLSLLACPLSLLACPLSLVAGQTINGMVVLQAMAIDGSSNGSLAGVELPPPTPHLPTIVMSLEKA